MEDSNMVSDKVVIIKHPTDSALAIRAEFEIIENKDGSANMQIDYQVVNKETQDIIEKEDHGPEVHQQVEDFFNEVIESLVNMYRDSQRGNDS